METFNYIITKWFDLNLGWFFINPSKEEWWLSYLKEKYPCDYTKNKIKDN